jgi:N-acetylmuramoyl-L-alanine amidase
MKSLLTIFLLLISTPSIVSAQQQTVGSKQKAVRSIKTRLRNAPLTRAETREAEQRLADMGYWTGAVDGLFDPASRAALIAFQKWEGRPVTGRLTLEELEVIRSSAAPIPRELGYAHVEVDLDRQVMLIVEEYPGREAMDQSVGRPRRAAPTKSADESAHSKVRVLPVSTGSDKTFMGEGQESVAHTPRGRFVVYDKSVGWENGALGSVYYANYISGGVAIHGYPSVPTEPASHGCIRIPMFAAREVGRLLRLGTIVLVYDNVSFVSAREWAENPKLKEAALLFSASTAYEFTEVKKRSKFVGIKKARSKIIRT